MNELYAEAGVKVKPPFQAVFFKVLLILALVFSLLLSVATRISLFAPLAGLIAVAVFYFWPRLSNIEYEYIFCDGEFDFDRITGGAKRKNMLKVDMDNVEVIASPARKSEFDQSGIGKIKDFSNNKEEAFMMIAATESGKVKVYFKPTEKMVECMYNKAPSKVKK